ncbi:MAG: carbohydrate binding family 9 domain-containing protein [Candidatus Aminicenantales bacterium]
MTIFRLIGKLALVVLLLRPLAVQAGSVKKSPEQPPFYVEAVLFDQAPKIDGLIDNPIWERGAIIDQFTQYEPTEGAAPSEKTIVYIGYDKDNLYIALRCLDSDPKAVRACLTQRDEVMGDDEVSIYLDTYSDQKQAFVLQVNPCGILSDGILTEGGGPRGGRGGGGGGGMMGFQRVDRSWDTYFRADAKMDDQGYTAEFAIPFKSLRFPNTPSQKWGLQIQRSIRRKNEENYWPPYSRSINGFLVQSGTLEIPGLIRKGDNFEIMPVVTGIKRPGDKFEPQAGLNAKWAINSGLIADMTLNPDFSQIEADMPQDTVNQRYPLYYQEKRPFFLEGKEIFNSPIELVYTRKIVEPKAGIKLTGRAGGLAFGLLSSYDANPPYIQISDQELPEDAPKGKALVNVFRLKQNMFSESYIGALFMDKQMGQAGQPLTSEFNRVAGVDGSFKFWNYNRFTFQVAASQSRAEGRKTEWIPAANFNFSHQSRHWNLSAEWNSLPQDFEAATGFFRRKDIKSLNGRLSYSILPQNEWIVSIRPSLQYRRVHDFAGTLTDDEVEASVFISGWSQSNLMLNYQKGLERYEGIDFRKQEFMAMLSSEPFSWLSGNLSISRGDGIYYDDEIPWLGYKSSQSARLTFKPLSNLRLLYNLQNTNFYLKKGGEKYYTSNILSQRITYQISKPMSLRLITDYRDYDNQLYLSFLFSYQLNPGTVFYLGIDDNQERLDQGAFRSTGRYYFIKFSYWWRV